MGRGVILFTGASLGCTFAHSLVTLEIAPAIQGSGAAGILAVGPWEWLFAVNVPIGIATFLIGRKSLPENPKSGSFDLIGSLLNMLMFGPIFIGIDMMTRGGNAWLGAAALVLGVAAGVLLD